MAIYVNGIRRDGWGGVAAFEQRMASIESTVSGHTTSISTLSQTARGITTRVMSIESTVSGHTISISTLSQTASSITAQVVSIESTVSGHTTSISTLNQTASSITTRVVSVESTVSSHTRSISTLNQTASSITTEVASIKTTVSEHTASISTLNQTASSITTKVTSLASTVSSHTTSISTLNQTASSITTKVTSLASTVSSHTTSISALNQTASSITTKVTSIESTVSSHTTSISTLSQTASSITTRVTSLASTVSSHTTSITEVTQTANKISWLVKSGTTSSNFQLTDRVATLIASAINIDGYVTFTDLSTVSTKTTINGGNITTGEIDANKVRVKNIQVDKVYDYNGTTTMISSAYGHMYVGGTGSAYAAFANLHLYASDKVIIGDYNSTHNLTVEIDRYGHVQLYSENASSGIANGHGYLGTENHPWRLVETNTLYVSQTVQLCSGSGTSQSLGFFGTYPRSRETLNLSYQDHGYSSVNSNNYLIALNNLIGILGNGTYGYGLIKSQ